MKPWLQYLIAFIVVCHGFIYVRIGPVVADTVKEWRGSSWLLGGAVTGGRLKALVITLHVMAGVITLACAAAIAFGPSVPGWWRPLAVAGGAAGLVAFVVFWDGQTQRLFEEGAAGAAISLMLMASAIAFPRAFD